MLLQRGLRVKGVKMARPALHEEEDDVLCLRRVVREPGRERGDAGSRGRGGEWMFGEQRGERQGDEQGGKPVVDELDLVDQQDDEGAEKQLAKIERGDAEDFIPGNAVHGEAGLRLQGCYG